MRESRPRRARKAVRALTLAGAGTALVAAACLAAAAAATAANGKRLRVGSLELERCATNGAWCGRIERALDPEGRVPDRISIYFEYYPHLGPQPAAGILVAADGGPGYPTTESRADFLALWAPLLVDRDVLLMDSRGTGRSGAINCRRLQTSPVTIEGIGACGRELGVRAPLYSTAYAADDLATLLAALAAPPADVYGVSYGTFLAQVLAVRHPERVRSLVLDGSYPLGGPDFAWYAYYAPAMRDKFNRACERSAPCAALPGTSIEHVAPALARLRARPVAASAFDADGVLQRFRADGARLAIVMLASYPAFATLRELDAAARAYAAGDVPPLARLMAETTAEFNARDGNGDPALFSEGLAAAVMCQDAPQLFDMRLPPAARARERDRIFAERERTHPDAFAPFTFDEYRAMPPDYAFLEQCVAWPAPDAAHPPRAAVPVPARFPDVPVLVLSGEFETMTSVAAGAGSAAQFAHAQQVVLANSFHVNALPRARSECGAQLAQRFIATLEPGDTGCAAAVPPLRLAPPFALSYQAVEPASAADGNAADASALRAARAALLTVGDLFGRLRENSSGRGVGLRGGQFTLTREPGLVHARLRAVRWTPDLAVSGTLDWPARAGPAVAVLEFSAGSLRGRLTARWTEGAGGALAQLDGSVAGRRLVARMPAP